MSGRKVVEESKFAEDLEKIIERDFYPDLEVLKNKKEYLDALERNDVVKLRQIQMKMDPKSKDGNSISGDTPASFETPDIPSSSRRKIISGIDDPTSNPEPPAKKLAADLHLDHYLSNFTSEDDVALEQLMKETDRQYRMRKPWLYATAQEENEKVSKLLALPEPEAQAAALDDKQDPRDLVTWKHAPMSTALFMPDGAPLSEKEKLEAAARKPREVIHENTRFKVSTTIGVGRQSTGSLSLYANKLEGRIGIDGREVTTSNTPNVGGYKYVATPSPSPANLGESPFMTWGQIESTPLLVDPSATPLDAPAFKIPDVPEREQLAINLAERASSRNRAKKETALRTAADSVRQYASPSRRIASMSPAAQKLLVSRISTGQPQSAYTPSPLSSIARTPLSSKTPTLTPTSVRRSAEKLTPSRSELTSPKSSASSSGAATKRAEDFF